MRKMFLGMLTFLIWNSASVHAQVLIGSQLSNPNAAPHAGAILDLQSNGSQGLLMPQVALTSASAWVPLAGNEIDGMTVFNLSDEIVNGLRGKGLYIWLNNRWNLLYHAHACDGVIIKDGARDYKEGSIPGDGAKAGGASNNENAPWPDIFIYYMPLLPGSPDFVDILSQHFTVAGRDLCVYKTNGNSGGTTTWADAVNKCADGSYADGDASVGWYLPNAGELMAIYYALGGTKEIGTDFTNFANIQAPSYVTTTAEPMISDSWSSTENATTSAHPVSFVTLSHSQEKSNLNHVRCVRRM